MAGYILVVDDDDDIRDIISRVLAYEGYEVVTARNGAVAVELIRKALPALILVDQSMPVMDGPALARLCQAGLAPRVPIAVITAALDPAATATAMGAADYLAKPFDLTALVDLVGRFMALAPQRPTGLTGFPGGLAFAG